MERSDNDGIKLLKKGKRGLFRAIFSRTGLVLLFLVIQFLFLLSLFSWFADLLPHAFGGTYIFSAVMILYLLNSRTDNSSKVTWLIVITVLPIFGALFYLFTKSDLGHRVLKERTQQLVSETKELIPQSEETFSELEEENKGAASLARYAARSGCHPVYQNTEVTYYPLGEDVFEEMIVQLEKAKRYIFLEFFIVDEGHMWGKILEILAKKASEGVEVRMMYDGTCEFTLLPRNYPKKLHELGIQCKVFSPAIPMVSTHYNYRDHRKIMVIDGKVGFTGGVNLADEYINRIEKYGHWKDVAVMLRGDAVDSLTLMFLQMWNIMEKTPQYSEYLSLGKAGVPSGSGFVMPFGDRPLDEDRVGERVYMDILNRATTYVHVMTPYLIMDGELETAIKYAAERGVEVSLILPGIPDKTMPYALAKGHYASLLDSGVKIYEYTPGFVHAKVMVSDDREAIVGTINMDYRSLYHHFECGVWLYDGEVITSIEDDFQKTLEKCRKVEKETIWNGKKYLKWLGILLKPIAPLL